MTELKKYKIVSSKPSLCRVIRNIEFKCKNKLIEKITASS